MLDYKYSNEKMMDLVVGTYKWMLMMTIVIAGGALLGKPPYYMSISYMFQPY